MMRGTTFGTIHSFNDLGLLQQKLEIEPAPPKATYVDVPGADGSIDLTEALGVGVKYGDRTLKWTYALYPGENWAAKMAAVSNTLNGLACHIVPDDDTGYYYDGRVTVASHNVDKLLRQIIVTARCRPYKLKATATTVSRSDLSTSYKNLSLTNDRMPAIPEITVGQQTTLSFNGDTYTVAAGTHVIPGIVLAPGSNTLKAKVIPQELHDATTDETGKVVNTDGTIITAAAYTATDFIDVDGLGSVTVKTSGSVAGTLRLRVGLYSSNDVSTFLSPLAVNVTYTGGDRTETVTVPAGAKYMRVGWITGLDLSVQATAPTGTISVTYQEGSL